MYSKQKSLTFGNYVPNDRVLNKKIHENPKYKHVKPAIDTGKNVRKHIDELKEKQKNCIYKKDEVFKRIKVSAFIKLALAVAIDLSTNENDIGDPSSNTDMPRASGSSDRRCIANVLMGVGELDLLNDRKKIRSTAIKQVKLMPYLLLDVRDKDAFSKCHIITAKHYPSTMLSRSVSYETEDLKIFKNVPYQLIIIYDDDESTAIRVATTLVERGYENIYLLTGGLKLALEVCPQGLTTSSQMLLAVHMLSQNTAQAQNIEKEYFSQEDIDTIQQFIEAYPSRGNPVWSSKHSQSIKSKSGGSSHRSGLDSVPGLSRASTTSRRDSICSSSTLEQNHQQSASSKTSQLSHTHSNSARNIEQIRLKSLLNEKTKPKKVPWK